MARHRTITLGLCFSLVAVLWLAAAHSILATRQEYVLTTTEDFARGVFLRTGIVNNLGGEVQLIPLGVAGGWITDSQRLPSPRAQLAVVAVGNRIYALGGIDNTGFVQPQVFSTTVLGNSLTQWVTQTSSLPVALAGHVTLISATNTTSRVYVLGGFNQTGNSSNQIFYAALNGDGSLGAWATNPINLPAGTHYATGVVHRDRVYLIGGIQTSSFRREIYQAQINNDGSLGAWSAVSPLPQPLALAAAVVYHGTISDTLYVLGGAKDQSNNSANVYFADINPDGSLTTWITSTGTLPEGFSSHTAVQTNGQVYVIGGNSGSSINLNPRRAVLAALIDENNSGRRLVDFGGGQSSWIDSEALPEARRQHGSAVVGGELFAIGGDSSNKPSQFAPSSITYHGPTTGVGSRYAPSGDYLSPVINVGANFPLTSFSWSTVITNVGALTITMRYHTSTNGMNWNAWSPLLPSSAQPSADLNDAKTVSHNLNSSAQYFQYQAFFSTTVSSATPFLMDSRLVVEAPPPDLSVSKQSSPPSVTPGNLLTYTITINNINGSTASDVVVTETLPNNTSFAGSGWNQVGASNFFTRFMGSIALNTLVNANFVVRVDPSLPPSVTSITNTVRVGGDPSEVDLANNTFTTSTPVNLFDLSVSQSDGVSSARAGQILTYTILYTNTGLQALNGVVLTDTPPLSTTFVGGTAGWTIVAGSYRLVVGSLTANSSGSATFVVQVASYLLSTPASLLNQVQIDYDRALGPDPNPANNIAVDDDLIERVDLRVSKSDGTAFALAGTSVTYSIAYVNGGQLTASHVILTDTVSNGLQYSGGSEWTPVGAATFTRMIGTLPAGASGGVTFPVQLSVALANGQSITNSVQIADDASQGADANVADNIARDVDTIVETIPRVDLSVSLDDGTALPKAGQTLTYTIVFSNAGDAVVNTVILTESIPSALTYVADATWANLGGGVFTRNLGKVFAGAGGSVTFVVQVNPDLPGNNFFTNTVRIGFDGVDANPADNSASDVDYVSPPNLVLHKDDGTALVGRGQVLTYTLTYENIGGARASNIVITETPATTLVDVTGASGWNQAGSVYTRNLGSLAPGALANVTFSVRVSSSATAESFITNSASISADNETIAGDNVAIDVDRVVADPSNAPDLQILGARVESAVIGALTTVVLTVANTGRVATPTWFFNDLYIDRAPLDRSDLGDDYYQVGNLAAGGIQVITYQVRFNVPGIHRIYFQADTCDSPASGNCIDPSFGRIAESNEANNIFGPVNVSVGGATIYLPMILVK